MWNLVWTLKHRAPCWQYRGTICCNTTGYFHVSYIFIYLYVTDSWCLWTLDIGKPQQLVMQAELPWPSGPVENPLRIDPEGHPKVVLTLRLTFVSSQVQFWGDLRDVFEKPCVFLDDFLVKWYSNWTFPLPNFGFIDFCEQIEPNSEFKRLGSWIWGAVATSCWALEAIHWFGGHGGSWTCQYSFLMFSVYDSVQEILDM